MKSFFDLGDEGEPIRSMQFGWTDRDSEVGDGEVSDLTVKQAGTG